MSQRSARLGFWITTSFFSFMMAFTAYNELASPQVAEVFAHLGFPSHALRLELSVAKVLGVLALLLPFVPCKLKEWLTRASPSICSRHSSRIWPRVMTPPCGFGPWVSGGSWRCPTCSAPSWRRALLAPRLDRRAPDRAPPAV